MYIDRSFSKFIELNLLNSQLELLVGGDQRQVSYSFKLKGAFNSLSEANVPILMNFIIRIWCVCCFIFPYNELQDLQVF